MERRRFLREIKELGIPAPKEDDDWIEWGRFNSFYRRVTKALEFKKRNPNGWKKWVSEFKREKLEKDLRRLGLKSIDTCPLPKCPTGGRLIPGNIVPHDAPGLILVPHVESHGWYRMRCQTCRRTFSLGRFSPFFRTHFLEYDIQKVFEILAEGGSVRHTHLDKNSVARVRAIARKNPRAVHHFFFPDVDDSQCLVWAQDLRKIEPRDVFWHRPAPRGTPPLGMITNEQFQAERNRVVSAFIRQEQDVLEIYRLSSKRVVARTSAEKARVRILKKRQVSVVSMLETQSWWIPPSWLESMRSMLGLPVSHFNGKSSESTKAASSGASS